MQNEHEHARRPASVEMVSMADQVRSLCSVITKIARADLQESLERHDSGISAIEHGVLRHLSHGVTSMAEISRLMSVAPSTLVYVVDGLVARKLVRRSKDPKDRRREPLLLEKKAANLFAKIPKMDANSALVRSLQKMSDAKRRDFLQMLEEFADGLPGSGRMYIRSESKAGEASPSRPRPGAKGRGRKHE